MRFKVSCFLLIAFSNLFAAPITMATWAEALASNNPYYSIYDGDNWSTPAPITESFSGLYDVLSACDPKTAKVIATWADNDTLYPYYAIYNNGTWSSAQPITSNPALASYSDVSVTFNPVSEEFMATWTLNSDNTPYYSIYKNSMWSTPAPIATPAQVFDVVFAAANTFNGDVIASWVESSSPTHVKAAIYTNGSWGTPVQISDTLINSAADDAFVVYDPYRDTTMITWASGYIPARLPYYSIYNGTSWSAPAIISNTITANDDVYTCFDSQSNTIIASWTRNTSPTFPYYSIFDGTEWSVPAVFPGSSLNAFHDVSVASNSTLAITVAAWASLPSPNHPYFSIYNETNWSTSAPISMSSNPYYTTYLTFNPSFPPINPPSSLTGSQEINNFGLAYEYYNTIEWTGSSSAGTIGYHIYKNGTLIASVNNDTFSYVQHNQPQKQISIYTVTAFDAYDNESPSISVTLP